MSTSPLVLLISRAARAGEDEFLARFAAAGFPELRPRHAGLFAELADGGLRARELARRLGTSPQAVAQLVDDLEAKGDVRRIPDPTDGRARLVELTDRGRRALRVCDDLLSQIERDLADALGATAIDRLSQHLEELVEVLGRERLSPPP